MRLSDLVQSVRDIVNDPNGTIWEDGQITRFLNRAQMVMFRHQVDGSASWFNHRLSLSSSDAEQVHASEYVYYLPTWAGRVTGMREGSGSTESRKVAFPAWSEGSSKGWEFDGRRRLLVRGIDAAKDFEIDVAKRPAPMFRSKRSNVTFGTLKTGIDKSSVYEQNWETDAYVGMTLEITDDGLTTSHYTAGQVRTVTASSLESYAASPGVLELTLDSDWSPAIDATTDYIETHAMIDDAGVPYLVLLAAEKCFQTQANVNGLNSIGRDIASRRAEFIAGCAPRSTDDDKQWGLVEEDDYDYDFNKDPEIL